MNNKLILVIVLVVLILGGVLLLNNKSNTSNSDSTNSANENQNTAPSETKTNIESTNVEATTSGFVPQTITIKAGTKVVWTNKSGQAITVNSASHPTHLKWPFLNLGKFDNDGSVSVVFEKAGTYKYHNHLNPSQTGTVIVE